MRAKRIASFLLAIIPIFSASCSIFGEGKTEEEKKITLKARNGEMIDCTPRHYQDYLAAIKNYLRKDVGLTDADFQAIERIMLG